MHEAIRANIDTDVRERAVAGIEEQQVARTQLRRIDGPRTTRDIGGALSTKEMGDAVLAAL